MSYATLSKPKTSDNQTSVKINRNFSKKNLTNNDNVADANYENQNTNTSFNFFTILITNQIHPKLKVSHPDDPYEIEADRVADQIMRMSNPDSQIHRKCSSCNMKADEELKIHRKSQSSSELEASNETANKINTSQGRPLDEPTKSFMEPRFGYDFSSVRIHDDSKANELADSVNARAFTVSNDIFLGKNESVSNRKLMAHELTHIVQNNLIQNTIRRQTTQPPPDKTLADRLRRQLIRFRRMFEEKRYGCWCGPGNVCNRVIDAIDSCCKQHDNGYGRVGVTSSSPPGPGKVSMWSSEGLKRTMWIDLTLVACTKLTNYDWHFYGPAARLFKEGVAIVFGGRAAIAAILFANPWIRW